LNSATRLIEVAPVGVERVVGFFVVGLLSQHRLVLSITRQVCDGPLAGREGDFVLKYFLLREGIRRKHGSAKGK
jgi:hypothetical protein